MPYANDADGVAAALLRNLMLDVFEDGGHYMRLEPVVAHSVKAEDSGKFGGGGGLQAQVGGGGAGKHGSTFQGRMRAVPIVMAAAIC